MVDDVIWGGDDSFTDMLAIGPTRCGKTAIGLEPMIYQLLIQKKLEKRLGISVIEPNPVLIDIPFAYSFINRHISRGLCLFSINVKPNKKPDCI